MPKPKPLTRRQRAVIEDLFTAEMEEPEVLDKHDVSRNLYNRWLADERFEAAFEKRIAQAYLAGRVILARYAHAAAFKLVELTACKDKPDIARRACLDIIGTENPTPTDPTAETQQDDPTLATAPLTPETASRILALLAEGKQIVGN